MEYLLLLNPNHFTWRRAVLGSVTANSRWRLLSAQWEAIVFVKVQNNRDSASKAITKFVLQWGRYKPSFPSTKELNGCTNHLWLNWCRVNKSNIQWPMSIVTSHHHGRFFHRNCDSDTDYDELSDGEINKLLIVTQTPVRPRKHEGFDRTGDYTSRWQTLNHRTMLDRLIVVFENIVTKQLKLLGAFKLKEVTALPENFPIQQKDRLFHKIKLRKLLYKTTYHRNTLDLLLCLRKML